MVESKVVEAVGIIEMNVGKNVPVVKSMNWHITSRCNYRCKFCFARDRGEELRDLDKIKTILSRLKQKGIQKINLAGGEPALHPLFLDILREAKNMGFTTSIVTNGYLLNLKMLTEVKDSLDWVGLSIDSSNDNIERELGRGWGDHVKHSVEVAKNVNDLGIKLKINTVVTKLNYLEDMKSFIEKLEPHRWKVFQYLHMIGCNDDYSSDMEVTTEQFEIFIRNNQQTRLRDFEKPVFERNSDMLGSYLMLSPDGDLTIDRGQSYSKIPLEDLVCGDISQFVDSSKYLNRGGDYKW